MRILILSDEDWNDSVYGNNVLTNWFNGFNAEFAQIYCSPGLPYNFICNRYFRITDMQMVKSIITLKKAGDVVDKPMDKEGIEASKVNVQRQGYYAKLKKLSLRFNSIMMLVRDAIWIMGRYNKEKMRVFIDSFNPDVIFMPRMATPKYLRLERVVHEVCDAPMVAFTGDNEVELGELPSVSFSLAKWRRKYTYRMFIRNVQLYKHYFMHSSFQAKEYNKRFGIPTSRLYKCGTFLAEWSRKEVNKPIRFIYAGKIYCNRWKSLAALGEAMEHFNAEKVQAELFVYTPEQLDEVQKNAFSKCESVHFMGSVRPEQLKEIYQKADVALHVESFDEPYRTTTSLSFSTKIVDLMGSTCAIMAICPPEQAGFAYLKENDAALCASSVDEIDLLLNKMIQQPSIIEEYAYKAWQCGITNHNKEKIQMQLKDVFEKVSKLS